MIPQQYQQLAEKFKLVQRDGQSDEDFMAEIDRLRGHQALIFELLELGGEVTFGITSVELRQAICARQMAVLTEKGFVKDAEAFIGTGPQRRVEIREIVHKGGRNPTVTVKYWIIGPWTGKNNQGRANHKSAAEFLKKATLASS